jgi:hypothetical protein
MSRILIGLLLLTVSVIGTGCEESPLTTSPRQTIHEIRLDKDTRMHYTQNIPYDQLPKITSKK